MLHGMNVFIGVVGCFSLVLATWGVFALRVSKTRRLLADVLTRR